MLNFPIVLALLATTASLLPTYGASNLPQKLSTNGGDLSALTQDAFVDSPGIGEIGGSFQNSALSMILDTSIQGSPQTYPHDRLLQSTTLLTGYMITVEYGDATCTKFQGAIASVLNTCTTLLDGDKYSKLTATAIDAFITFYSDKECTKVTLTGPSVPYTSGCTDKVMRYVSSKGDFTSSSALVSLSRYVVSS